MSSIFSIFRSKKPVEIFWHTDIHSHVCPGIDDGSPDVGTSVQIVQKMYDLGMRRMIVTPHVTDETFPNTLSTISHSFEKLHRGVEEAGIPMQLDYSAEYRVGDTLRQMLRDGTCRPLPGGYILVENPWLQEPYGLEEFLFNLQSEYGLRPVLAHPERYPYYQTNPRRYTYLHSRGIMFQVNLLSLAGQYDKACRFTAEMLLEEDLVDFIGSDVHRPSQVDAIESYLHSGAYRLLESRAPSILNDKI